MGMDMGSRQSGLMASSASVAIRESSISVALCTLIVLLGSSSSASPSATLSLALGESIANLGLSLPVLFGVTVCLLLGVTVMWVGGASSRLLVLCPTSEPWWGLFPADRLRRTSGAKERSRSDPFLVPVRI